MTVRVPLSKELQFKTEVNSGYICRTGSGFIPAVVVGLLFYPDELPTLSVMMEDGALIDHVPLHQCGHFSNYVRAGFKTGKKARWEVCRYTLPKKVYVFKEDMYADYLFTVDNVIGNESYHLLIDRASGSPLYRANYEVVFGHESGPKYTYKKLPDLVTSE